MHIKADSIFPLAAAAAAAVVAVVVVVDVSCSTSRGLHFWEVVPLDVLLAQLAAESQGGVGGSGSAAAQKLHQLLVPSYLPSPEEGVVSVALAWGGAWGGGGVYQLRMWQNTGCRRVCLELRDRGGVVADGYFGQQTCFLMAAWSYGSEVNGCGGGGLAGAEAE